MSRQNRSSSSAASGAVSGSQVANVLHVAQGSAQLVQLLFGVEFITAPATPPQGLDYIAICTASALRGAGVGAGSMGAVAKVLDLPAEWVLWATLFGAALGGCTGYLAVQNGSRVRVGKGAQHGTPVPSAA